VRSDDIVSLFDERDPERNRILVVLLLWDCGQRDSAVHQIHSASLGSSWIC
jgi:hypothetical protein